MAILDNFTKLFWWKSQAREKSLANDMMYYRPLGAWNVTIDKNTLYQIYRQNPDVRSCVRIIAQYVGRNYFFLQNQDGKASEQDAYDEYDTVWNVMKNKTFFETVLEIIKHSSVCGELYLLPTTDTKGNVNGFQLLHPKTITKRVVNGKIAKFLQYSAWGKREYDPYDPVNPQKDQVMYFQFERHTSNELDGMGVIEGIIWDVLSDMKAMERNYAFFENDMTPPSVILVDENTSEGARQILKEQLEAKHKWTWNAHKPFLWVWVKDWKQISISPKDMEHIAQRKITTDKVCAAMLVPKSRLWYVEDVNRATSMADEKNFIEGTVNSYQLFIEYVVNEFLKAYFPDRFWSEGYEFVFERQSVEDATEVKKMRLEELKRWGITLNEYRAQYGMEAYTDENADKPLITKDVVLLEDVTLDPVIDTNNS